MRAAGLDPLALAQAALAAIVPSGVAVATSRPQDHPLLPPEGAHLAQAVQKRRQEFAAGRDAAHRAMEALGLPAAPIPVGEDRAPTWPEGPTGSISHSNTLAAAAVTTQPLWLGIDVEPDEDLPEDVLPTVCSAREVARIEGGETLRLAKLIFSAKEAAFKAQYAASGAMLGFEAFDVELDLRAQSFVARFTHAVPPFAEGAEIEGRFAHAAGHILTAVAIPQSSS